MAFAITRGFERGALIRLVLAGSTWGLTLAASFIALSAQRCGLPCPADVAVITAICVGTGLLTIGPFAAIAARR